MQAHPRQLRLAWEAFVATGRLSSIVRPQIADSWRRCLSYGVPSDQIGRPVEHGFERLLESRNRRQLLLAGQPVIARLAELTEDVPLTFTLADADGLVLVQRGDRSMLARDERIGVLPGTRWSEWDAGTNGMGTALATGQMIQVVAAEHYCEGFHAVNCTAAPIRHPLTSQVVGVFDLTSQHQRSAEGLWALAAQSAGAIASAIRDLVLSTDIQLLRSLGEMPDGLGAFAVDLYGHRTMANRGAAALIGPRDHAALWPSIREVLDRRAPLEIARTVDCGRRLVLTIRPVLMDEEPVGALVLLRESRRPGAADRPGGHTPLDLRPFDGRVDWLAPARACLASRKPILILGEPGTGKTALAHALVRQLADPPPATIDCAAADDGTWEEVWRRPPGPGSWRPVLLDRVTELGPALQRRVVAWLDSRPPPEDLPVIATAGADSVQALGQAGLRRDLLDRLGANQIVVPPLRRRARELERIVTELLGSVASDLGLLTAGPPDVTPECLAVLRAYPWPGNVRELENVLRHALTNSRRRSIDARCLPPAIVAASHPGQVARLQQVEEEEILQALHVTGGQVARAASLLGISRSTVYRRLHAYQARRRAG